MKITAASRALLPVLVLTLAACGTEPQVADDPGAQDSAAEAAMAEEPAAPHGDAPAPAAKDGPTFGVPEGWERVTPQQGMRAHEFHHAGDAGKLEMYVYAWPNDVGGIENNIARWIGDRDPASLTSDERKEFDVGDLFVTTVFLADAPAADAAHGGDGDAAATATFYAYVERPGTAPTWTLKATGPAAAMRAERANLETYVQGL